MAAADYFVHRHHDTEIPEDHLDVWRPIPTDGFDDQPSIQINQAAVGFDPELAVQTCSRRHAALSPQSCRCPGGPWTHDRSNSGGGDP